jgi:hypothetical protein
VTRLTSPASVVKTLTDMTQLALKNPRNRNAAVAICLAFAALFSAACSTPEEAVPAAPATSAPVVTEGQPAVVPEDATIVEEGTTTSPSPTATTSTPPPTQQNITIETVEPANPVVIQGLARTFENNVVLRVRDARGGLITETFTTAEGEMGQHSPYTGRVWVTRDPGGRITVEALEYSAKDGAPQHLVSKSVPYPLETIEATVYFPDQSCTGVNAFKRRLPKTVSLARLLVEALMAGPLAAERSAGATVPFPSGSAVKSVNLKGGTLTVDFNERLQNVGGACRAQMIRASVEKTLGALPNVSKVVLKAGGSEKLALQP